MVATAVTFVSVVFGGDSGRHLEDSRCQPVTSSILISNHQQISRKAYIG
jgi:hypothetical protein